MLMGYREEDVIKMIEGIKQAMFYLPPSQDETKSQLIKTWDFLDGLLVEGRI